jgi:hypothetical protein
MKSQNRVTENVQSPVAGQNFHEIEELEARIAPGIVSFFKIEPEHSFGSFREMDLLKIDPEHS